MSDQKITDPQALEQYVDLLGEEGPKFIIEIIDTFLEEAPDIFSLLKESYATRDSDAFRRAAHTLKTGCATVGAINLAQSFQELENAGTVDDISLSASQMKKRIDDFGKMRTELEFIKGSMRLKTGKK